MMPESVTSRRCTSHKPDALARPGCSSAAFAFGLRSQVKRKKVSHLVLPESSCSGEATVSTQSAIGREAPLPKAAAGPCKTPEASWNNKPKALSRTGILCTSQTHWNARMLHRHRLCNGASLTNAITNVLSQRIQNEALAVAREPFLPRLEVAGARRRRLWRRQHLARFLKL